MAHMNLNVIQKKLMLIHISHYITLHRELIIGCH